MVKQLRFCRFVIISLAGARLQGVVMGNVVSPSGNMRGLLELSMRPSDLRMAEKGGPFHGGIDPLPGDLAKGSKLVGYCHKIERDHLWIVLSPNMRYAVKKGSAMAFPTPRGGTSGGLFAVDGHKSCSGCLTSCRCVQWTSRALGLQYRPCRTSKRKHHFLPRSTN